MPKTQKDRLDQLKGLLQREEEGRDLDYKQDLYLETDGDKAEFVKDVLALANSAEVGYIVTGVEDDTWQPVGIREHHKQIRLNDVLKGKTDPPLEVEYFEHDANGLTHGMVTIKAADPPYLVAVHDRYGGKLSTAPQKQSHIVRGTIYVRIQDKNEGASRVHVDEMYKATYGRENQAREALKRFVDEDAQEMDRYVLEDNESFIRLIICPTDNTTTILDGRLLSDREFQRGFQDAASLEGGEIVILGEESISLVPDRVHPTPRWVLKMDVRGNVSYGYVSLSEDDAIDLFDLCRKSERVFEVVAQLYTKYDSHGRITRVSVSLRAREFKHKHLEVRAYPAGWDREPHVKPATRNLYRYEGEEDPRIFPRKPIEASVSDLAARPDEIAAELMDLFKRSYRPVE